MAAAPPPPPPPRVVVDTGEPGEPGEPSNRWPWVALGLGVLIIAVAVAFFLFSRQRAVNVTVEGTPTVNPVARAGTASPGPPPTVVPPTLPASATLAPTATAAPSPTQPPPSPTPPPPPTAVPAPTSPPVVQPTLPPQATQPPPPAQPAATVPSTSPPAGATAATPPPGAPAATPPPAATAATPPPAPPAGPTPFAGQVAGPGGFGNTRADFDAAFGAPTGETPDHLVVYRKGNFEYHVGFMPDANGRAALLVGLGQPQPLTLEQAVAEAHRLLPKDAQPPNPPQEANPQFVVERYTSQLLAQALNRGQSAQFLAVYVRDPAQAAQITRFIIGPGTDPNALVNQGR